MHSLDTKNMEDSILEREAEETDSLLATKEINERLDNSVEATEKKCIHHWVIDPAYGPTSKGKCKRCGTVKLFYNTYSSNLVNHIQLPETAPAEPIPSV